MNTTIDQLCMEQELTPSGALAATLQAVLRPPNGNVGSRHPCTFTLNKETESLNGFSGLITFANGQRSFTGNLSVHIQPGQSPTLRIAIPDSYALSKVDGHAIVDGINEIHKQFNTGKFTSIAKVDPCVGNDEKSFADSITIRWDDVCRLYKERVLEPQRRLVSMVSAAAVPGGSEVVVDGLVASSAGGGGPSVAFATLLSKDVTSSSPQEPVGVSSDFQELLKRKPVFKLDRL